MSDPFGQPWLLPAPTDFRARLKTLRTAETFDPRGLRALVQTALNATQLEQAGRVVTAQADDLVGAGLRPLRLGIVATHTAKGIAYALPAAGPRHGLLLRVALADYGQAAQQLLDPDSEIVAGKPDAILLALDAQALGLARLCLDADEAEATVTRALDYVAALRAGGRDHAGAAVIVQTLVPPLESLFGNFDGQLAGTVRWLIETFNTRLRATIAGSGDLLLDTAFLAATVGLAQWHDARLWHDAKLPFALDAVPLYVDRLCALLAAFRGLARKCLVLDLDNTLWGGIIGDDGIDGILLGQGSGTGEAHLAVQAFALDLRARGVVLAVCSKNEDAAARLPFTGHSEMLLREEHIAVFLANWTDKAQNLRAIAATLNIGTDALVFLDDNPAERAQVRGELPEVAVPEIGSDPADFVRILGQAGYFEAVSFGEEDRGRAAMYSANAERAAVLGKVSNLADYHASLEMVCTIAPFDDAGRARIAQLANKSNQFNLTTRRYTEADIAAIAVDPARFAVQVRLADRFGDNGMISVVIFAHDGDAWRCETWLMSCRVLGRRVEEAVLAHVAAAARAAGATRLTGEYLPSAKNAMVREHFGKLGFTKTRESGDGASEWALDLTHYVAPTLPMTLD